MCSAIYRIRNLINGHEYVGSAANLAKRWREHKRQLRRNKHHSLYLQRAWNKYGDSNFAWEIVEYVEKPEQLLIREQYWLDTIKPVYNICKIAGSTYGVKASAETRKRLSDSHRGQKAWNKGLRMWTGRNAPNKGKVFTKEHRENLSKSHIGIQMGEDAPSAKLTWSDVRDIRNSYPSLTQVALAAKYGVHRKTIARIIHHKTWRESLLT